MNQFVQQAANGLLLGSIYSLIALGLSMIFGMMNIVNVAHGDFYMLGALVAYYTVASFHLPYAVAVVASVAVVGALGAAIERGILRRVRESAMVTTMLITLGLSLLLQNFSLMATGGVPHFIRSPFSPEPLVLGLVHVAPARLFAAVFSILFIIAVHLFLTRTKWGNAMRACFQDKTAASLAAGIDIEKVYALTFALGVGMAALAGTLLGTIFFVDPMMGAKGMTKSFVVVIVGGMGSFVGAIFSGLLLGVTETLAAAYLSSGYKDVVGFILVVLVLTFRPAGLFGKRIR